MKNPAVHRQVERGGQLIPHRRELDELDPELQVPTRGNLLASLVVAIVIAGAITAFVFGTMLVVSIPWGANIEPLEEIAEIGQGHYEQWMFSLKDYRVRYHVKVVEGGNVDVYAAGYTWNDFDYDRRILGDHSHEGVNRVDDVVNPPDGTNTLYLIVDNSNDAGAPSDGNVTVKIKLEHYDRWSTKWICVAWAFMFLILVSSMMWNVWGKKIKGESKTEGVERTTEPSIPGPFDRPTEEVCPDCGGEYLVDEASGWPYCPKCERWAKP